MRPTATIQLATIELVIGKPNGLAISTAFCDGLSFFGSWSITLDWAMSEVRTELAQALTLEMWFVSGQRNKATRSSHSSFLLSLGSIDFVSIRLSLSLGSPLGSSPLPSVLHRALGAPIQ